MDDSPDASINAYQLRDDRDRPVIVVTVPMIAYVQNDDEMAFVLAHEAAHHIARHLDRRRESTRASALIFANAAARTGASGVALETAARVGAALGARAYAKDYELEADAVGARIARDAGYDANRVEAVRAALR